MDILASEKRIDNPIPARDYRDYDICTGIGNGHKAGCPAVSAF